MHPSFQNICSQWWLGDSGATPTLSPSGGIDLVVYLYQAVLRAIDRSIDRPSCVWGVSNVRGRFSLGSCVCKVCTPPCLSDVTDLIFSKCNSNFVFLYIMKWKYISMFTYFNWSGCWYRGKFYTPLFLN